MQRLHNGYAKSIEQMTGRYLQSQRSDNKSSSTNEQVLHEAAEIKQDAVPDLKFSKHAGERLIARNINLSREQMQRLATGTTKAREKGIGESLVLVDDLAFIVNVKNNTVITAMDDSSEGIFTNIDGAVIG